MIQLLIIIVNYRTAGLTVDCLNSLAGQMQEDYFAVVVDNASGDDSEKIISRAIDENGWGGWCGFHGMPKNGGFAWGNNQGLKAGPESEYILLLNSDTIVRPGCLEYCVNAMRADRTLGALSCNVLNADGTIQNVARKLPNPLIQFVAALGLPWKLPRLFGWADIQAPGWDRSKALDVGWIGGAFLMTRSDLVKTIGLLDETFFFYGEDIEFCHRVWKSGYKVRFDPGAEVVHLGGASSGTRAAPDLNREKQRLMAKYNVQRLCYGKFAERLSRWTDRILLSMKVGLSRAMGRDKTPDCDKMRMMLSIMREI